MQEGSQERVGEELSRVELVHFRSDLEERRARLMNEAGRTAHDMAVAADGFPDPTDRGSLETGRNLQLRIRDRERRLLGKIDAALERIEDGSFGLCLECEEPIGPGPASGTARDHPMYTLQAVAGTWGIALKVDRARA